MITKAILKSVKCVYLMNKSKLYAIPKKKFPELFKILKVCLTLY